MIGYLENPFECSKNQMAFKLMLDEKKDLGTYVSIYTDKAALFCSYDLYYEDLETALKEWSGELDSRRWIQIEDALRVRVYPRAHHNPCPTGWRALRVRV